MLTKRRNHESMQNSLWKERTLKNMHTKWPWSSIDTSGIENIFIIQLTCTVREE